LRLVLAVGEEQDGLMLFGEPRQGTLKVEARTKRASASRVWRSRHPSRC
jgi:hypothetical protein